MFFTEGSEVSMKYTLKEVRHDYLLNFSEESLFDGTDRTFSKVTVGLPYPIHNPLPVCEDLVPKLLTEKANYNNVYESIKKRYNGYDKKQMVKEKYGEQDYMHLPQYLVNLNEENDPDPTFNSNYNYYYTGGNLEQFRHEDKDYLIRSNANNILCVTNVCNEGIINEVTEMNFCADTPIYNINCTETNDGLYFVLREKSRVSVVKLRKLHKVKLKYNKPLKEPILDAKLFTNKKLGIVNTKSKFTVKDIESDGTLFSLKTNLSDELDIFQQFKFFDENTALLMSRSKVKVIDTRNKIEEMCFEPKLLKCNDFCNFCTKENDLLVTTKHYVLKTDLRMFENVYHYSHSLSDAPCYCDYATKDSDTYLAIAGQDYDSKVLFTGKSPFSIPYKVPNINRTLIETRLKYPDLVLEQHIDKTIAKSITGLKVLNLNNEIHIFTSNCFGEIFKQTVYEKEPDKTIPIKALHDWSENLQKPEPALYLTHFEEISDIRFSLNEPTLKTNLKEYLKSDKSKQFLRKFDRKYNSNYVKGQLAKDFLSIWEDSDDEDNVKNLPQEEALDKVTSWIKNIPSDDLFKDEDEKF